MIMADRSFTEYVAHTFDNQLWKVSSLEKERGWGEFDNLIFLKLMTLGFAPNPIKAKK